MIGEGLFACLSTVDDRGSLSLVVRPHSQRVCGAHGMFTRGFRAGFDDVGGERPINASHTPGWTTQRPPSVRRAEAAPRERGRAVTGGCRVS